MVPVGTRHKELIIYRYMNSLDTHFKDIILRNLYKHPTSKRIQCDIMDELQVKLHPVQLVEYRKQLVIEELITEENPDEQDSPIEITAKGYEAIETFGSYQTYITNKQKSKYFQHKREIMESRYLKMKTLNIIITMILTIISFITGILLSDQIKELLK